MNEENTPAGVKLSVVVPVYNERFLVAELVHRVLAVSAPEIRELELLLVDDGSKDGSLDILRAAGGRAPGPHPPAGAGEEPGEGGGDPPRHRRGDRRPHPVPGRRPRVRPARLPAPDPPVPGGRRGRRLRLALPAQRAPPRPQLPPHARQPAADPLQQLAHRPQPDRHGDLLQGLPGAAAQVDPDPLQRLRHGAGDHRQGRQARVPDLRGADQLPRPHLPRGEEDRLEGRLQGVPHDGQVPPDRRHLRRGRVRLPHPRTAWRRRSTSTAGWPRRSRPTSAPGCSRSAPASATSRPGCCRATSISRATSTPTISTT